MTRDELMEVFRKAGIRRDAYSLDNGAADETYVLERDGAQWIVYYGERGLRSGLKRFAAESDALEYLQTLLLGDPSVRAK